jgi:hypothetical protein
MYAFPFPVYAPDGASFQANLWAKREQTERDAGGHVEVCLAHAVVAGGLGVGQWRSQEKL